MCGQRPYDGAPTVHAPSEAISKELVLARTPEPYPEPHLPRQLLELLRNCWKNDPKERPSARDCGDSILTFVTHEEFGRDMVRFNLYRQMIADETVDQISTRDSCIHCIGLDLSLTKDFIATRVPRR